MSDTPSVSTVQVIDPRIESQPNPVYAVTVGPEQNQYYTIPQSGLSDTYITFNNLTTLGKDRAYLDTFELEITVTCSFRQFPQAPRPAIHNVPMHTYFMPVSFPFNSVCEQARININGGAFFSQPMATIRAKERYWDDRKLQESFANHTPCQKAFLQDELCCSSNWGTNQDMYQHYMNGSRTRMFSANSQFGSRSYSPLTSSNFSVLPNYESIVMAEGTAGTSTIQITWREPIFCSPFSSRYDATYGRPLYNITSIDLAFNLVDLRNMFLVLNEDIQDFQVHIDNVNLCYQVLTVTAPINHSFTVIPYRRYVPYITDMKNDLSGSQITRDVTITSGVYTLNEVPTAIWVFMAPCLGEYQQFNWDGIPPLLQVGTGKQDAFFTERSRHTNNKLFGFMKHISISCGNTTQILNTASIYDLYRIAKANGCQDTFEDWSRADPFMDYQHNKDYDEDTGTWLAPSPRSIPGCGSVLRLIPGTDIVLPEQKLVPGANANNLVFQVQATFDYNGLGDRDRKMSLWLLFEYVGVASITPGNCVVTMNPLGNGAIMAAAPTISTAEAPSTTEGSGWLDTMKNAWNKWINPILKGSHLLSTAANFIPGVGSALSTGLRTAGYGYKRPRDDDEEGGNVPGGNFAGGAVMGLGDFC